MEAPPPRVWPAVAAVMVGVLLAALDATVVGTAIPTIITALGGVALYPWVFSAYMLASTAFMPVFGSLSDRLGRRGPFVGAVGLFAAASFLAGAAPSMAVLVLARGLQGIGAGGIIALSLIIFGDLFPGARRGRMQGLISAMWGLASIVGPVLGGLVVDRWSWRWVFHINVPLGVLVAGLVLLGLRETAPALPGRPARRLDVAGAAALLVGVTALLFLLLEPRAGGAAGSPGPGRALAALVGLGALAAFIRIERTAADPLVAFGLFRQAPFAAGCGAGFFAGAAMFGAIVHLPLLVQWGEGTDATTAGLSLMATSGGWSFGGFAGGQLVNRLGFRRLAIAGMGLMTASYLALALRPDGGWGFLLGSGAVLGVGMGCSTTTLIVAVQTLIPLEQRGIATSAVLFFRNIGATVGVAVMGAALTARLGVQVAGLEAGIRTLPPSVARALVTGMGVVFWLGVGATALGLVATLFMPRGSPVEARSREGAVG